MFKLSVLVLSALSLFTMGANAASDFLCEKGKRSVTGHTSENKVTVRTFYGKPCKNKAIATWYLVNCKEVEGFSTSGCYKFADKLADKPLPETFTHEQVVAAIEAIDSYQRTNEERSLLVKFKSAVCNKDLAACRAKNLEGVYK